VLRPSWSSVALVASFWLAGSAGCLGTKFTKPDPTPKPAAGTQKVLDLVASQRQAKNLPPLTLVPELRTFAVRGVVAVSRGDQSLATAAHAAALHAVEDLGRHTWVFATDCGDLAQLRLPDLALESRPLMMNAAATPGADGRMIVLIVIAEPGTSSLRAEQMGGSDQGVNPTLEVYAHPVTSPGNCGAHWPATAHL
jgi:hypothetical protein